MGDTSEEVYLSAKKAAKFLGIHYITLYRWAKSGRIQYIRTPTGRLRFPLSELAKLRVRAKNARNAAIYARVISEEVAKQGLLEGQVRFLKEYADKMGYNVVEIIKDIGLPKQKSLARLVELARSGFIRKVLVVDKTRLCMVLPELLEEVFRALGVEIEVVEWNCEEFKRTKELEIIELMRVLVLESR